MQNRKKKRTERKTILQKTNKKSENCRKFSLPTVNSKMDSQNFWKTKKENEKKFTDFLTNKQKIVKTFDIEHEKLLFRFQRKIKNAT